MSEPTCRICGQPIDKCNARAVIELDRRAGRTPREIVKHILADELGLVLTDAEAEALSLRITHRIAAALELTA